MSQRRMAPPKAAKTSVPVPNKPHCQPTMSSAVE
jgi:hypothetical protein